jgi:hypothetical protein
MKHLILSEMFYELNIGSIFLNSRLESISPKIVINDVVDELIENNIIVYPRYDLHQFNKDENSSLK